MSDIERKGICVLTADIKATKADTGGYDIVLSMPNVDRDGEIIDAKAFEPLPSGRMPIDVDHGMTVLTTVGSGVPVYDGDVLKLSDFKFAGTPLGQEVQTLVDEGHISKMSVAFMDARREVDENDGKAHVRKAELLNAAIVAIPSLREADIVLLAKSALAKVGARNSSKDAASIQAIHDEACTLGADCAGVAKRANVPADEVIVPTTKSAALCESCGQTIPADTDPEEAAADEAAATPPADVDVAQALIELSLAEADLALD